MGYKNRHKCSWKSIGIVLWFLAISLCGVSQSHAAFLNPGVKVLTGRGDTTLKICNRTGSFVQIAFIYENERVQPSTYVAKGWFSYGSGECSTVAVNGLFGVMSVLKEDAEGNMVPHYMGGSTPFENVNIYPSQSQLIEPEYFCLGEAPFSRYYDSIWDFLDCQKKDQKTPFGVVFYQGRNASYTLNLN